MDLVLKILQLMLRHSRLTREVVLEELVPRIQRPMRRHSRSTKAVVLVEPALMQRPAHRRKILILAVASVHRRAVVALQQVHSRSHSIRVVGSVDLVDSEENVS